MTPKIEGRGRILRGQTLQVPSYEDFGRSQSCKGVNRNIAMIYCFFFISSSSSFGTAPKIEERGQVLRGQALQVPMLLIFTIMGTDSAGTSSAGPMNQIERVQYPKCIFWTRWIGSYHNVSKDYRLSIG